MPLGSDRSYLLSNPVKKAFVRLFGDTHFGRVLRFMYLRRALRRLSFSPKMILDAGCGRGEISQYLARHYTSAQVVGFDANDPDLAMANQVRQASRLTNLIYVRHDAQVPLTANQFDLAIAWEVLHHVPDDAAMLRNLHESLRTPGVSLLHVMHKTNAYRRVGARRVLELQVGNWKNTGQVRAGYAEDELAEKLRQAGFTRTSFESTFGWIGMSAHSLFELGRNWTKPIYLMFYPFLVLLGYADLYAPKKWGGGILAIAWKE